MRSWILRLPLVLSLVLVAVFSGGQIVNTRAATPYDVYFPWVANGVTIDDPRGFDSLGPFYGSITIQNPTEFTLVVEYVAMTTGEVDEVTLDELESTTLGAGDLGVPAGTGSGVVLRAKNLQDHLMPIAAVLKQSSPNPLEPNAISTSSHVTSAGYTGLRDQDIQSEIVLPVVQTNNNWNTLIRVTNFSVAISSQTHLMLQPAGGGATLGPFVQHTPPGQTTTFDLLELGVPEGWVGSAVIASGPLGAVAERVKNETKMLVMNTSSDASIETDQQFAALVFRDWFHWNTGISIANLAGVQNDVAVTYYSPEGAEVHSDNLTIPANGMDFLYLPAGAGDEAFVGSAIIEGTEPFVGAVDEVKYLGEDDDTGHAMSYMVEDDAIALKDRSLLLPLYQRGDHIQGAGDTTGIQVFNPQDEAVEIEFRVLAPNGLVALAGVEVLGPREGHTIYALDDFNALAPGFTGSVVIDVTSETGGIVAVSNNVNYAVEYDGSASFNLMRALLNFAVCEGPC